MFIIKRCFDDGHGNLIYKSSCIIGIYDDFHKAYDELLLILQKLKYQYNENDILLNDTYFFSMMMTKNNKEITNGLCFEIIEYNNTFNQIKMK